MVILAIKRHSFNKNVVNLTRINFTVYIKTLTRFIINKKNYIFNPYNKIKTK